MIYSDKLSAPDKARLRAVYDDYASAAFGRLNTTAEALDRVCRSLGWISHGPEGYLAWGRRMLDIKP